MNFRNKSILFTYRRLNYSNPWDHMRYAMERFPTDYVAKLNRYMPTDTTVAAAERPYGYITYNDDVRRRMKRYFDEECTFLTRDDPGLLELKDAVRKLDLKAIDLEACDLDHMRSLDYYYRYYPYDYWWWSPTYSRYRRRYYPSYLNSRYYKYKYTYPSYYL
ncbi:uncharacterized protein LOC113501738 isoform X4 [Trichoplusia ni]|uniref:Uncharacterized protein LOC113501738 isoform X4 n=1 Tax=Trichoplusia ni TaxID=7111 RepID=A0A7E5WDK7_TRINI|nr:uncharacterized protein LOC113501738 isoform X4 [Trichoplusia ni]